MRRLIKLSSVLYSIVYYYNGAQRYDLFLQQQQQTTTTTTTNNTVYHAVFMAHLCIFRSFTDCSPAPVGHQSSDQVRQQRCEFPTIFFTHHCHSFLRLNPTPVIRSTICSISLVMLRYVLLCDIRVQRFLTRCLRRRTFRGW